VRLGIALAAVVGLIVAASSGAAATAPPTRTTVYHPYLLGDVAPRLTVTRTAKGECFTGSLADQRRDAWRCELGNEIADPCFSDRAVLSWVLCPEDGTPFGMRVVRLALSKALPKPLANKELPGQGYPWAVKLADGTVCTFLTGATYIYHGRRVDYGCDGKTFLAGTPNRSTATWTIILGTGARSRPRTVPISVAAW
jgi:hypothetical protein